MTLPDEPAEIEWRDGIPALEPPARIRHVRDASDGKIADRLAEPCEDHPNGTLWRWRHNGNSDCWMEMDGIGPWEGWR